MSDMRLEGLFIMKIFTTVNPDTISNIYFITDDAQKYGVIIDPGSFAMNVYKLIKSTGAEIKKIIITHNSPEQTGGIPLIKKIYAPEIYAKNDNIMDFPAIKVTDGTIIQEGDLEFKVMETPVHSYDSISILSENTFFVGDVLQAGALSSLDKKDPQEFELKIIQKYFLSLPDYTIIYPGHGPATTIDIEKRFNPYFQRILNQ
jgi:hydroxyacylglutathione hydrolase